MGLFKAYDIRGVYGKDFDESFAEILGYYIMKFTGAKKVIVGFDSRLSGQKLFKKLTHAITNSGVDVVNIGLTSRPMLNWIAWTYKYDLAIMISASHDSKEYNGFKFLLRGHPLSYDNGLNTVEKLISEKSYDIKKLISKKKGKIIKKDYTSKYIDFLINHFNLKYFKTNTKKILKNKNDKFYIISDASNGGAGKIIRELLKKLPIKFKIINEKPDGNFPNHDPNPLKPGAMDELSKTVSKEKANLGFIVDPDADRIRFVDEKGQIIDNSYIQSLVCEILLKNTKSKTSVVHDLISRRILSETITNNKGIDIISRVGFVYITTNMKINKSELGFEASGHCYFKNMNYMDSALMMLIYVLNAITKIDRPLSEKILEYNKYVDLGELNYPIIASKKELLLSLVEKKFSNIKGVKISKLDGFSVETKNYWFTVRTSNTEPLIRLRIEGISLEEITSVKSEIESIIKNS